MSELDLYAAHEHAEAVYLYCRKVAMADRVSLPQDVREFFNRRVPALLDEVNRLREQLREARVDGDAGDILADLVDDEDPCTFDHHGYCQAHGWFAPGECPHARAKRWMAPRTRLAATLGGAS